jgi:hypothetical protein
MSQGKDLRHVRQKLSDHSFGILDLLNSCMKSVDKSGAASSRRARCELLATKAANTIERLNGELASFVECSEAAIDPEPPPRPSKAPGSAAGGRVLTFRPRRRG